MVQGMLNIVQDSDISIASPVSDLQGQLQVTIGAYMVDELCDELQTKNNNMKE